MLVPTDLRTFSRCLRVSARGPGASTADMAHRGWNRSGDGDWNRAALHFECLDGPKKIVKFEVIWLQLVPQSNMATVEVNHFQKFCICIKFVLL